MKMYNNLQEVAELIQQGQVGVITTDTIYGLCALASSNVAVNRMYKIKKRESKPGTLLAANVEQLAKLGIKKRYLKAVQHYWPGPVSVVVPLGLSLQYLHMNKQSLAVRIPKYQELAELLKKTGPLVTTSANMPGLAPANNVGEAVKYFGEEVDFYVDGGDISNSKPSTIIRVVDDAVEVLREGAVTINEETGRIL